MNAFLSSMTGSKPKKSALESAVAKLKEGKRLDELKQFKAALALYEDGLATLLGCLKQERDAAKKAQLAQKFETYLQRAEQLKASLGARAPDHHAYGARVAALAAGRARHRLQTQMDASPNFLLERVKSSL